MIRNHSKSGLLGSEFRLPFGKLVGGGLTGLFRINLREPSFERLGELGRLLRRQVDRQDEFAPDFFRLEAELLVDSEDELQGLARRESAPDLLTSRFPFQLSLMDNNTLVN